MIGFADFNQKRRIDDNGEVTPGEKSHNPDKTDGIAQMTH